MREKYVQMYLEINDLFVNGVIDDSQVRQMRETLLMVMMDDFMDGMKNDSIHESQQ